MVEEAEYALTAFPRLAHVPMIPKLKLNKLVNGRIEMADLTPEELTYAADLQITKKRSTPEAIASYHWGALPARTHGAGNLPEVVQLLLQGLPANTGTALRRIKAGSEATIWREIKDVA